jgi:hypothetical protein
MDNAQKHLLLLQTPTKHLRLFDTPADWIFIKWCLYLAGYIGKPKLGLGRGRYVV